MPRQDLTDERRPHIIAAAARAIARFGLGGATQERIAEEAGMSRPHIRHYAGNRQEVLDSVWETTMQPYADAVHRAAEDVESTAALDAFLHSSFVYEEDDIVVMAFVSEGRRNPHLQERTRETYDRIEADVTRIVQATAPDLDDETASLRAFCFMAMLVGAASLDQLRPDDPRGEKLIGMARAIVGAGELPTEAAA